MLLFSLNNDLISKPLATTRLECNHSKLDTLLAKLFTLFVKIVDIQDNPDKLQNVYTLLSTQGGVSTLASQLKQMCLPFTGTWRDRKLARRAEFTHPVLYTVLCGFAGVTILLSLTVFLNLVAESMPTTSDAVPLIGNTKSYDVVQSLILGVVASQQLCHSLTIGFLIRKFNHGVQFTKKVSYIFHNRNIHIIRRS